MKRQIIIVVIVIISAFNSLSQTNNSIFRIAKMVSKDSIKAIVDTLTTPAMEGRGLRTKGIKRAEKYIKEKYKSYSLLGKNFREQDQYLQEFQPFQLSGNTSDSYIKFRSNTLKGKMDFVHGVLDYKNKYNRTEKEIECKVFFIGAPNQINDLDNVLNKYNLDNKLIIIYQQEKAHFSKGKNIFDLAYKQGARGIITIMDGKDGIAQRISNNEQALEFINRQKAYLELPQKRAFLSVYLSPEAGSQLLGIKKRKLNRYKNKFNQIKDSIEYDLPQLLKVYIEREKIVYPTANIIGVIPGKKEGNKNVIISAHYDHLGKYNDIMFPGANDNASGVSILIELARVFSNAYQSGIKPKHNIIFLAFSAEETGVLGSEYFVENPPFSLERTIANINIDMVGRQDQYHDTIPNYIYAIAPDSLNQPIKKVMDSLNIFHNLVSLSFMEKHPAGKKFFSQASDQRHFLEKNIPAILLFNGMHSDLHRPTDTPEKLNYQTIENVGELVFLTVWNLANEP
jgi:hypothetical protein